MKPKIYTTDDHHIRHELIDPHALHVLQKLQESGFQAYLVGGGVRDLLMRKRPKDFDISTSAQPEEIKALFKRCLLIGRRFRLAHVRFGKQVIEVATFRSGNIENENLITQDNVWGSAEEDALRRDFTINGLFYDPVDHKIIDYVGGFEDLKKHLLRVIGEPTLRFKQDPVRMLRMQKFRARFGFHVEEQTLTALNLCLGEITKSSSARIVEELFRMLESGYSAPFFKLVLESGLLEKLFPELSNYFKGPLGPAMFTYLEAADQMNSKRELPLDRALLAAALLYPILEAEILSSSQKFSMGTVIDSTYALIHQVFLSQFSHFPRRIRAVAHFILQMQFRITPPSHNKHVRKSITHHRGFPIALVFLKLRAIVEPKLISKYEYWKGVIKENAQRN
jgi:poly(A) polymerase